MTNKDKKLLKEAAVADRVHHALSELTLEEHNRVDYRWVGTRQKNGAIIILAKPSDVQGWIVVMAKFNKEHVVWNMCEATKEFQTGRYFPGLDEALPCYREAR
jgi:hypothetical protein